MQITALINRNETSPQNVTDWSEFMRVNRIIRPQLYADAIDGAVSAASAKIGTLDVSFEANRIAKVTGFSPIIAKRDLVEAMCRRTHHGTYPAVPQWPPYSFR